MNASTDQTILARLEQVLADAEVAMRPLEVDPWRGWLFELFVTANGAGMTSDDSAVDLTADGICAALSARWGLKDVANTEGAAFAPKDLAKIRLLWSLMRMWMEWTYAWDRWNEFHLAN